MAKTKQLFRVLLFLLICPYQTQAQVQTPAPDSLSIMIGQMLFMGIGDVDALSAQDPIVQDVLAGQLGGVILYEKNIAPKHSAAALRSLITMLQLASPRSLWIGIDEEGGVVNRLKPKYGFMVTAPAAELGTLSVEATRTQAKRMAQQLQGLGFNLNFAPVVDLALNKDNKVIVQAKRAYGRAPKTVAAHAATVLGAHRQYGVLGVVKHFPGHGSSTKDTHLGLVDVSKSWHFQEMLPYTYLIDKQQLQAVMTAHVVNAQLDATLKPATLSRPTLQDALRTTLHFQGVIFSDDMHMRAITAEYKLQDAVFLAIQAGVDVFIILQQFA